MVSSPTFTYSRPSSRPHSSSLLSPVSPILPASSAPFDFPPQRASYHEDTISSHNLCASNDSRRTGRRSEHRPYSSCDLRPPQTDGHHRSHASMDAGHSNRRSIRSMFFSKKRSASNLQQTNPEYGAPRRIPKPLDPISRQPCAATVSGPIEDEDVPLDLSNLCPPPSTPEFSASPERTASPAPNALIWLPDEEVWIKAGPSVDAAEAERAQWERAQREAQMMQLSNLLHPPSSPPRIVLDDDDDHCQLLTPEVVPPPCYVQSQWEEATKRQTARPGWWESVAERRLGTSA